MTWYCSWYCPLKSKLFLSKKLRWRFYLASSFLSRWPIQIRENASGSSIFQLYSPTKLFQNVGIIYANNTFCYIYNSSSVDHITSLTYSYCLLLFLIRLSSKRFGLPTFLKTKLSPPVLHLLFQLFTKALVNVNFGNFTENIMMADNVSNFNAWFPIFGNLFLILIWSTMWFINLVYSAPQLNIRGFFHSGGDNVCDGYFFGFLSIFIFFKK